MISSVSHNSQYGCNLSKISPSTSSNIIKCSRQNNDILIAVGNQIKVLKTNVNDDHISDPSSLCKAVHNDLKIQRIISVTISNDYKFIGIIAEFPASKANHSLSNAIDRSTKVNDKLSLTSTNYASSDVLSSSLLLLSKLNKAEVKCVVCSFKKSTDKVVITPSSYSSHTAAAGSLDDANLCTFRSVSFSPCNNHVAILIDTGNATHTRQSAGALIYDRKSGLLKYSVPTTNISFLLFCPKAPTAGGSNITRFCTITNKSSDTSLYKLPDIKIWRIASKELQCIDVIGIKSVENQLYSVGKDTDKTFEIHITALTWLSNDCIMVGTSNGKLLIINGNQVQTTVHDIYNSSLPVNELFSHKADSAINSVAASDAPLVRIGDNSMNSERDDKSSLFEMNFVSVQHILQANEIVVVLSSCNKLAVFDFRISAKAVNSIDKYNLNKLYQVDLVHVSIIYGAVLGRSSKNDKNEPGTVGSSVDGSTVLSIASSSTSIADDSKTPTNCYHVILSTDMSLGHLYIPAEPVSIIAVDAAAHNTSTMSAQESLKSYPGVLSSSEPQKHSQVSLSDSTTADNPGSRTMETARSDESLDGSTSSKFNFMERLNLLSNISAGNDFDLVRGTTIRRPLDVHFYHYHSSSVFGMAVARRTTAFLSVDGEGMLKLWDYCPSKKLTETSTHGHKPAAQPSLLSYNFFGDLQIFPTTIHLHPTVNPISV